MTPIIGNYIQGQLVVSIGTDTLPVTNPSVGQEIARVPLSTAQDVDTAVRAAQSAFQKWSTTPIKERTQVFFRYKTLLERDAAALAALVHEENGKIVSEAMAEIEKAIEVTEFACALPQLVAGEILEVSRGVECRIDRYPIGVVASITPFNFPSMVPHWTIPNALVLGNTMLLKPSELVPLSSMKIAALLTEAGLPDGVFNVVHGGQAVVEALCDHPGVEAVTFVGSTRVAKLVYQRATSHFKRALCLGGAKNHLIVLPDAHEEMTASNVAASMSGCAGQRCMAASAMVAVGAVDHIIKRLCEEAKNIIPGHNLGAVISLQAKERIERYITEAERDGAKGAAGSFIFNLRTLQSHQYQNLTMTPIIGNYIQGQLVVSNGTDTLPVTNPSVGSEIARVPLSTAQDVDTAVRAAQSAFQKWSTTPIKERTQVFFRYKTLLERDAAALAALVHEENGKIMSEAMAEIEKAIEVTEFACSMPQLAAGEILEVSRGVECRIDRYPIGVVASITPFNFPSMVPHWTIPNALVLGNTMVLKPSELVPLSSMKIAALLTEAGLPDGVFNVVHGGQAVVEALCDHPGVEAVTFVGSTRVAKLVYQRATAHFKRALCLGGAKNHLIVLPDAHEEMTASNVAASMSGCAGQRCMAASAMVAVGAVDHIIKRLCEEAKNIIPGHNLGAVISLQAKERIERYITEAEREGAKVLVDGRNTRVTGKEDGFYVGPTVIDHVRPDMKIAREEVFGPVLAIMRVQNIDEALTIENASPYGNAASVFTQSGSAARYVIEHAHAGMVGVNIGVPVPREPFSFGGWNQSKFGACDITGKSSIEFFTRPKKSTIKWNPESRVNWMS